MPLARKSYCPTCNRNVSKNPECEKDYCPKRTGKFGNKKGTDPFYNMPIWKGNTRKPLGQRGGIRERQLLKQPMCQHCLQEGRSEPATVVDHITEWKTGKDKAHRWKLFTDPDNLQSLCTSHHNAKTARNN